MIKFAKIQFKRIKATHDGEYILTIYYISADTRPAKLLVNDEQVGDSIFFQSNGDCTSSWNPEGMSWKMIPITLKKGSTNTITIQAYDDLWGPNFDRITIHPVLSDEEVVSMKSLTPDSNPVVDENTYTLDGRIINSHSAKGVYIKNGKKRLASSH